MSDHDTREGEGSTLEKDRSRSPNASPNPEFKSNDPPDVISIRRVNEDADSVLEDPNFFRELEDELRQRFAMTLVQQSILDRVVDDAFFCSLIRTAIEKLDVSQAVLAQRLQTQSSNITRWKEGRHAPVVYGRAGILWTIHAIIMTDLGLEPQPFRPRGD